MEPRRLLIALALLSVLSGAYYWSDKLKKEEADKPKPDASPKVVAIPADQIQQISWKRPQGDPVTVRLNGQSKKWEIVEPKPYPVDDTAVSTVTGTLSSLASEQLVEEKAANLTDFGLDQPSDEITVTKKDGKTTKLLIGRDVPIGGGTYVKLANDAKVFTISTPNRSSIEKTLSDLRDKRLVRIESDRVNRALVKTANQTIEFGRTAQGEWQILQPKPLRADSTKVDDLVAKLATMKLDLNQSEEDSKKAASAFASGKLLANVSLTDQAGTQSVEIHSKDDKYYAKSSATDGVYPVEAESARGLDNGLDTYRNRKLFEFGFDSPEKVEIKNQGKTYAFDKTDKDWKLNGTAMDVVGVLSLVDKLRDFSAGGFLEGTLGQPTAEITVISSKGKRKEHLLLEKSGSRYRAQREGEPSLYDLDDKTVDDVLRAAADIKTVAAAAAASKGGKK